MQNGHTPHLLNGHLGQNVITKNSLNLQTTATPASDNNNTFTPDTDFVADFGSANIFNATEQISTGRATATMRNNASSNGHSNTIANGKYLIHTATNGAENDMNDEQKNANANFADFDHNPIYNAAGKLF